MVSYKMAHEAQFALAPKVFITGTVTAVDLPEPGRRHPSYMVSVRLKDNRMVQLGNRYASGHEPRLGLTLALSCTQQAGCRDASRQRPYPGWLFWISFLLVLGAFNGLVLWSLWRAWRAEHSG